jgi:hypothetical protein
MKIKCRLCGEIITATENKETVFKAIHAHNKTHVMRLIQLLNNEGPVSRFIDGLLWESPEEPPAWRFLLNQLFDKVIREDLN